MENSINPDNVSKQIVKRKRRPKLILKNEIPNLTEDNIESVFDTNFDNKIDLNDDSNYNTFLNKKEILNRNFITNNEDQYTNLYPSLDDPNFNIKIAEKEEFNETRYDGTLYDLSLIHI